jgi:hypothetical protein
MCTMPDATSVQAPSCDDGRMESRRQAALLMEVVTLGTCELLVRPTHRSDLLLIAILGLCALPAASLTSAWPRAQQV